MKKTVKIEIDLDDIERNLIQKSLQKVIAFHGGTVDNHSFHYNQPEHHELFNIIKKCVETAYNNGKSDMENEMAKYHDC